MMVMRRAGSLYWCSLRGVNRLRRALNGTVSSWRLPLVTRRVGRIVLTRRLIRLSSGTLLLLMKYITFGGVVRLTLMTCGLVFRRDRRVSRCFVRSVLRRLL